MANVSRTATFCSCIASSNSCWQSCGKVLVKNTVRTGSLGCGGAPAPGASSGTRQQRWTWDDTRRRPPGLDQDTKGKSDLAAHDRADRADRAVQIGRHGMLPFSWNGDRLSMPRLLSITPPSDLASVKYLLFLERQLCNKAETVISLHEALVILPITMSSYQSYPFRGLIETDNELNATSPGSEARTFWLQFLHNHGFGHLRGQLSAGLKSIKVAASI